MADGDLGSANTLTGRGGKLSVDGALVARTTQWAVSQKLVSVSEWGDSDSGGYTCRAAGRKDGTFTCEGKYDETGAIFDQTQFDLFQPDDIVAALLYLKHPSLYYNFPRHCVRSSISRST